jgi:hypothetical protein
MEASTCVVDGQQRLNAIREFVAGKFPVNGRLFPDLTNKEKEDFLKYEVPVIDFDLDAGDERLKEVFKRLNRTFYSLSSIERMATEFSASEFLLVARVLSGDISSEVNQLELGLADDYVGEAEEFEQAAQNANNFLRDPGISEEKWQWMLERASGSYSNLVGSEFIFSHYEAQRKVPLMFVLNVMCSIEAGYFNRNARVKEYLERYNDEYENADELIGKLNRVADFISNMNLPDGSMWWNKANFFTMSVEFEVAVDRLDNPARMRRNLEVFEADLPAQYALAAREAVNNRNQRAIRGRFFRQATGLD